MPDPLDVLLIPMGSYGDVHPFAGIGVAMQARGHRLTVLANPYFEDVIVGAGVQYEPLGDADDYRRITKHPDLWHPRRGTKLVFQSIAQGLEPVYEAVRTRYVPGRTVVAAASLALGARVAQEKLGVPTATVHLQPSVFRSAVNPPVLPGIQLPRWAPAALHNVVWRLLDRAIIDPLIGRPLNAFRAKVGLTDPVRGVLAGWWNSPQRVIGLFPAWYAPPPPDWPPQARLTGFPLYDEGGAAPLAADVLAFLAAGEPPVAFTPGSAMFSADRFFAESAAACVRLGRRGLLLSRHADHIPRDLPPGVRHVPYAPFSELLPRCAAIVHHGGIGTSAQAMAAGVPQLVMPFAHDQFDNADRLGRLGVARTVPSKRYEAAAVARALGDLIASPAVAASCRAAAAHFPDPGAIGRTCELIEGLAATEGSNVADPARWDLSVS